MCSKYVRRYNGFGIAIITRHFYKSALWYLDIVVLRLLDRMLSQWRVRSIRR